MLIDLLLILAIANPSGCSIDEVNAGLCTVSNSGSSVDIGATRPGGASGGGTEGRGGTPAPAPRPTAPPCDRVIDPLCRLGITYTVAVLRPTLSDVASFAPAPLPLVDEPDGVGIVGMPVNFVVDTAVHQQTGELFDVPVTVRFTPASVLFRHGDGTSREAADGGRTWAALSLPQFSATGTSHAYAARGTYAASAIVRYAADVDFGSGWVAVPGLIEIPTPTMTIEVLEVRTALVERTCLENPAGPGC